MTKRKPKLFAVGDIMIYFRYRFFLVTTTTSDKYLLWDLQLNKEDSVTVDGAEDYGAWTKL